MQRTERDKICKNCTNHNVDKRYGIICGLTDNFSNFDTTCKDYAKAQKITSGYNTAKTKGTKRKKKKGVGSLIGSGFMIWIIIKLVLKVIRSLSE